MSARCAKPDPSLVTAAAIVALMEARWESNDLLSRRSITLAPDLLRGHAAELAASAIGRDQLLGLALEEAARDLEGGRPPLADGPLFLVDEPARACPGRSALRDEVLGGGGVPLAESQRVADEIEQRQRRECIEVRELSQRLVSEARLQELLWDDPRIPATGRTRLVMLCSAPRLLERARELDPSRSRRRRDPEGGADEAFRELDVKLREAVQARQESLASPAAAPAAPRWSHAAGWLLLVCLFGVVLVGLIGIG